MGGVCWGSLECNVQGLNHMAEKFPKQGRLEGTATHLNFRLEFQACGLVAIQGLAVAASRALLWHRSVPTVYSAERWAVCSDTCLGVQVEGSGRLASSR